MNMKAFLDLQTYKWKNEDYKVKWEEAGRSNEVALPTLDGVTTKAIKSMCNMNKSK
jgi:hypothetical protein